MPKLLALLLLLYTILYSKEECKGEIGETITLCTEAKKLLSLEKRFQKYEEKVNFLESTVKRQQAIIEELMRNYVTKKVAQESKNSAQENFKPTTFRAVEKLWAFSSPSKKATPIREFAKNEAFTAKSKKDGFVKVSGYFVNGVWTPPKEDMWVDEQHITP